MISKVEIRDYNQFEFVTSPESTFIIIKFNNIQGKIQDFSNILKDQLKRDYMNQPGVYFLRLTDGYYIGETENLNKRLSAHNENKDISTITFATYKSEIDRLEKEQIKDLEAILIEYAEDSGLMLGKKLQNKKQEKRKYLNMLNSRENEIYAKYIWDKISYLNLNDIISELKSNLDSEVQEKIWIQEKQNSKKKNPIQNFVKISNVAKSQTKKNDQFFNYVPFREIPSQGYRKKRLEIFNKDLSKKALFLYLYQNIGNCRIDNQLTETIRNKGWVTAATLAFFRIETNGKSRGILKNKFSSMEAQEKINLFVERNY